MMPDDLVIFRRVASQKMSGLTLATQNTYLPYLQKWEKSMRRKALIDYDVSEVEKWRNRPGNATRAAAFPIRCVEMVQTIAPERVSGDFFVPQGLWSGDAFTYRQKVIAREIIEKVVAAAMKDIEETTALTRWTVIPFLILMAVRTGMNVESLVTLRRDCCTQGADDYVLRWFKGRSGGELRAEYFPMLWGPRELARRVQELTVDEEFLWVVEDSRERPYRTNTNSLRDWFKGHELRHFPLREIRPAMATLIYEDTGDIMEVKRYLHHESVATTILYLAEYAVLPKAEEDIANALDNIARKAGLL